MERTLLFYFIYFFFSFFLYSGCTYSPSGENYTEIPIPEPPETTMTLLSIPVGDTIDVPRPTNFSFNVSSENQVTNIQIFLNGEPYEGSLNISERRFYFHPNDVVSGIHKIEIIATVKSESGSLSDNLNLEQFLFLGSWYLRVDKEVPNAVEIQSVVENEDGLIVSWNSYERANFLNYQFNLHYDEPPYAPYKPRIITNRDQTNITFPDYIGQELRISVSVNTNYGVSNSPQVLVNSLGNDFLSLENNDSGFTVFWMKNKFPNNFGSYTIYTNTYGNSNFATRLYTSPDINDTSFTYRSSIFAESLALQLIIRPKTYEYFSENIISTIEYSGADRSFEVPQNGSFSSANGNTILFDFEKISMYKGSNGQLINSVSYSNGSRSINSIFASSDLNTNSGIIYKLDTESLGYTNSYNVETLTGIRSRVLKLRASLNSTRAILTSDKLYLFDYETKEILATQELPRYNAKLEISADGNLINIDNNIYAYENGVLELIRNSNTNVQTFFASTEDIYYEVDQSNNLYIDTFSYKNRSPINEVTITGFRSPKIYFSKERDVFLASGYYRGDTSDDLTSDLLIVSPSEGLLKSIKVYNPNASYYYNNNTLYSSDNIKLELDLD